jgi:hypothetical protein
MMRPSRWSTPGGVEVVQGHGAVLHVGANTHLLGRADQHRDVPGPAGSEQPGQVGVCLGFVHEPNGFPGQPACVELVAEFVVGVPPGPGGTQIAEHELQRPAHRVRGPIRCPVLVVPVSLPGCGDSAGGRRDFARGRLRQPGEAQIQGRAASVAGDLEHVVFFGADGPVADRLSPPAQAGHVVDQVVRRCDGDGLGDPAPIAGTLGQGGYGQVEVRGGLDVGEHVPHAEHLGHVAEPGEPALDPEAVPALRGQLHLGDHLPERRRPRVEHRDAGRIQQVGPQVALHDVGLGDRVGDRRGGGEGDHPRPVTAPQVVDLHVQVGGPHGPVDGGVGDVGRGVQVLVPVRLVDAEVVHPGRLERDARVLGGVQPGAQPFLRTQ